MRWKLEKGGFLMLKWLDKLEEIFISLTLLAANLLVVVNVIIRAFGHGTMWSEELIRYMVIWVTFIGISYCVRVGGHISIELIPDLLKGKSKVILESIIYLTSFIFSVLLTWYSVQFVHTNYLYGQQSPALEIPIFLIYLVIPISGGLMTLRYVTQMIEMALLK